MEIFEENLLQGIDALLMPLDSPIVEAFVPIDNEGAADDEGDEADDGVEIVEDDGFEYKGHWVGANGGWIAVVQHPGRWYMQNVYRMVKIGRPPVQHVGIHPYRLQWYPCTPFTYSYQRASIELLKIQITMKSHKWGDKWHYDTIAVFDKFIAIIQQPHDRDWIILRNGYLAPAKYVDAIATDMGGTMERIYTVTKP